MSFLLATDIANPIVRLDASQHFHLPKLNDGISGSQLHPTHALQKQELAMHQFRSFTTSFTFVGLAFSALLGIAAVTVSSKQANAVVYCTYVGYPQGCIARAGVVLRPRPVARAAVRANTVGSANLNGGVNRVGVRR